MAHLYIEVPLETFEEIKLLQHRILCHEIEGDEARAMMSDLLAPYASRLPVEGEDTCTIGLYKSIISTIGSTNRGKA